VDGDIRVLVVEHHAPVREGLRRLFTAAPGIELVAVTGCGEEAVALAAKHVPTVIVIALSLPGLDAVATIGRLVGLLPGVKVVTLSTLTDRRRLAQAKAVGATAHVLKDAEPGALLDVVAGGV
jgi:DNA-binding NarL/FixJ family response regulator